MKCAFVGHSYIYSKTLRARLVRAIKKEINNGCTSFIMGTHGDFDSMALSICRRLRSNYKEIDIEVVITSLATKKKSEEERYPNPYTDVKTVMYDIEDAHYKQQITLSNRKMIDECDTLICYVDEEEYRSGAKTAMRYAQKRGLKVVNLYGEQDNPLYDMTEEEKDRLYLILWNEIKGNNIKK